MVSKGPEKNWKFWRGGEVNNFGIQWA